MRTTRGRGNEEDKVKQIRMDRKKNKGGGKRTKAVSKKRTKKLGDRNLKRDGL